MGGRLGPVQPGLRQVPTLMIRALRDPEGANLDRVQVVKGWLDVNGKALEKVYDVAWAGDRKPGKDEKLPPVGNTVDVIHATYSNSIGRSELSALWRDPAFHPAQRAFYYVRVLEIPTPTWLAYDRKALGIDLPKDARLVHQERAYTSPIWYSPS